MPDAHSRISRADSRNRLSLGNAVEAGRWYSISVEPDGVIVLTPVTIVAKPSLLPRAA